jgi:hypothetical protein
VPQKKLKRMTKTIEQSIRLAATPAQLFDAFLDSRLHSAVTGGRAKMSRKAGGKFTAWGGQLRGTQGWPKYYWEPWKKYLAGKSKT